MLSEIQVEIYDVVRLVEASGPRALGRATIIVAADGSGAYRSLIDEAVKPADYTSLVNALLEEALDSGEFRTRVGDAGTAPRLRPAWTAREDLTIDGADLKTVEDATIAVLRGIVA